MGRGKLTGKWYYELNKFDIVNDVELFVVTPIRAALELLNIEANNANFQDIIDRLLLISLEKWEEIEKKS